VNPSAAPAPTSEVGGRHMTATALERDPEAVDQLIARVLSRAHRTMGALSAPNEARAILHIAHSFADELAATDPGFDRVRFIRDATKDPS
jgi:hypothetical protein